MPFADVRGIREVVFHDQSLHSWDAKSELLAIPGVIAGYGARVQCSYDAAPIVAKVLGQPMLWPMPVSFETMPGRERYVELGFREFLRSYQKQAALHLTQRVFGMLTLPPRTGKSPAALAAATLLGAKRILIVCPAIARLGWAEEVEARLREQALILGGRGAKEAFWYEPKSPRRKWLRNDRKLRGLDVYETTNELNRALEAASVVIVNYDLLVGQTAVDCAGQVHRREELRGWAETLSKQTFDVAILDECHLLRGRSPKQNGESRRERTDLAVSGVPRVWGLTATPIFGYVRDLWGQLDILSRGMASGGKNRTPFCFEARYAAAEHEDVDTAAGSRRVWKADGRSNEEELRDRMKVIAFSRSRAEILPDMPAKTRQIIRVDGTPDESLQSVLTSHGNKASKLTRMRLATLAAKIPVVAESVVTELAAREKCVVGCYHRVSAETVAKALEVAVNKSDVRTRMREVNVKVWMVHGELSSDARFEIAKRFREHDGAAVIVATIASFPVAIRLDPASSVHFVEFDWNPAAMLQFEDRPFLPGVTRGLHVISYILQNSIDEHVEKVLLPKLENLARISQDADATSFSKALDDRPEQTVAELWASLTAGLDLDDLDVDD